ncbi:MAG: DOMON-like domain-containing protein [Pseudomonadota bacterium]|nr:DOMON-like domain-containing protein [Pseudomonadota bacterium]
MTLLVRHPDTPPGAIQAIDAELRRVPGGAVATFRVVGDVSRLIIPSPVAGMRADELWQTTCFELFVAGEGSGYREFNLSPSGAWAAYEFDDHRAGMRSAETEIHIEITNNRRSLLMTAKIMSEFPNPAHVGLTAVIEEADGAIRYWSTAFAPGRPDFHAAAVRSLLFDGVDAA